MTVAHNRRFLEVSIDNHVSDFITGAGFALRNEVTVQFNTVFLFLATLDQPQSPYHLGVYIL